MEFKETMAIYKQIADYMCDSIVASTWQSNDRIPSVREMAVALEVNPNTVMRSYTYLQNLGIIYNERGIGYFVASDALDRIVALKKEEFISNDLPEFFRKMDMLGLSFDEVERLYTAVKEAADSHEDKQ